MIDNRGMVSIIVPVYNVEFYLPVCLESIRQQTYTNFECILVDDGSTDNGGHICDQFVSKDIRFKVIHKKNSGPADARNTGLDLAKGEFICFIDSDDIISHSLLEKSLPYFDDIEVDIVLNGDKWFSSEDEIRKIEKLKSGTSKKITSEHALTNTYSRDIKEAFAYNVVWNKIYRKNIFENDLRFESGKLFEDTLIVHHLYDRAKTIVINPEIHYYYRLRKGSILKSDFNPKKLDIMDGYKNRLDLICNYYSKELKFSAYRKYVTCIMCCYNDALQAKQSNELLNAIYKRLKYANKEYHIKLSLIDTLSIWVFIINPKFFCKILCLRRRIRGDN